MVVVPAPGQILRTFGGQVDVRVEIDTGLAGSTFGLWDSAEWDVDAWGAEDPDWNDITPYVVNVSIDRGATRWGERFRAGTATIVVDNTSGIFTPDSLVPSPWHLPFRPGRRIRVIAIPDPTAPLTKQSLFYGEIDATFDSFGEGASDLYVSLPCTDFMASWADHDPPALETATGVQDTDERVNAALDRMDWPVGLRDIQTGVHTVQTSFLAQSTLEECQIAAEAEGGAFFCSRDGKATFKARDWLSVDARSNTIQGYVGYEEVPEGENTAHVIDVETSWEITRVINQIQFARAGSSMYEVEDTASQAINGIRTYQRTDFRNNTDAEIEFLANRLLNESKDARIRIDSITLSANEDPNNEDLNRLFWDSDFGDLISAKVQTDPGWFIEKLVKIMGIRHQITADDWEVTFRLDDVFTVVGGSTAQITVLAEGFGENPSRAGASEALIQVNSEGGGALSKAGGSEASVNADATANGTIPRIPLMDLLAPLAWWRMGNGTSTTADETGNGHTLTWVGGPAGASSGGPIEGEDRYVIFDQVNDYATVANEADLEMRSDMSIEFWVRPHDDTGAGAGQAIITCRGTGADAPLYEIYYAPDINLFQFFPASSAGTSVSFGTGSAHNVWHHIVVTIEWSGSDRIIKRYKNGALLGQSTLAYQPGSLTRAVNIGRRATAGDLYFDGDISEIAIFDRVLTASEAAYLYQSTYL